MSCSPALFQSRSLPSLAVLMKSMMGTLSTMESSSRLSFLVLGHQRVLADALAVPPPPGDG